MYPNKILFIITAQIKKYIVLYQFTETNRMDLSMPVLLFLFFQTKILCNFRIHRGVVPKPDGTTENKPNEPDLDNASVGSQT